jgi:hypothetical protein
MISQYKGSQKFLESCVFRMEKRDVFIEQNCEVQGLSVDRVRSTELPKIAVVRFFNRWSFSNQNSNFGRVPFGRPK